MKDYDRYGIRRTWDWQDVDNQTRKYMHELPCFWPEDWVSSPLNWALIDDHGNLGLLDYQHPILLSGEYGSAYEPHYYFNDRGGEALRRAKAMIRFVFDKTDALSLIGKTPILKKGAWYIVRMIGFKRTRLLQTEHGPMIESIMTKEMWNKQENSIE